MLMQNESRWTLEANIEKLKSVPLVKPDTAGSTWKGVPHYDMAKLILKKIGKTHTYSFHLDTPKTDMYFGAVLSNPAFPTIATRVRVAKNRVEQVSLYPSIGLCSSNSGRRLLTFYFGYSNPQYNLAWIPTKFMGSRYTTNFNLEEQVHAATTAFGETIPLMREAASTLQSTGMSTAQYTGLLFAAGRKKMMPWSRIGRLADRFEEDGKNIMRVWNLLCEFSTVVGSNPPSDQFDQLYNFSGLVTAEFSKKRLPAG